MKVAILGFGPAGLIAAHTLAQESRQVEIDIFGDAECGKSEIGGAQYLHHPLDEREMPDGEIDFVKLGDPETYKHKIYPNGVAQTSWDNYEGIVPAWSLHRIYDSLWDIWSGQIKHRVFDANDLFDLVDSKQYDLILSSIPAPTMCLAPLSHAFPRVSIRLARWTPLDNLDNVVMYSGRECDAWYRTSVIFGDGWSEFGSNAGEALIYDATGSAADKPLVTPLLNGLKPLGTDCCCFPQVTRIGRFGTWDRKVLLHEVPAQVRAAL